jgi:hypothetical protein
LSGIKLYFKDVSPRKSNKIFEKRFCGFSQASLMMVCCKLKVETTILKEFKIFLRDYPYSLRQSIYSIIISETV